MLFEGFIVSSLCLYVCCQRDRAPKGVKAAVVLVGDEMAEENAIARHDVRTTTREERRLFLLVMPAVCLRRSKVNRSQVSPSPLNPSPKRFIPNQVWIIPTTEGQRQCPRGREERLA
jgi:hypothetical protein